MKMQSFLLSIPSDYSITVTEFFHWFTSRCFISSWLIFSNFTLLAFPSSLFQALIRHQGKLACKFSLWSFRVMKAELFSRHSTLSTKLNFLAMFLASNLIDFSRRSVDFSYVFVAFSFRNFLFCSGGAGNTIKKIFRLVYPEALSIIQKVNLVN